MTLVEFIQGGIVQLIASISQNRADLEEGRQYFTTCFAAQTR